jgi:tetratricopeptide (TPR) repeat protein
MAEEKFSLAVGYFEASVEISPGFIQALGNLGVCYERLGRLQDAAAYYEKALRVDPRVGLLWSNLSNVFVQLSRFEDSLRCAIRARSLEDSEGAILNMAISLFKLGRYQEVVSAFPRSEGISQLRVAVVVGRSLVRLGRSADALEVLTDVQRRWRSESAASELFHIALGEVHLAAGGFGAAAIEFHRASIIQPSSYDAKCGYAQSLVELDAPDQRDFALTLFEHLRRLRPDLPTAPYNLGLALLKRGSLVDGFDLYRYRGLERGHHHKPYETIDRVVWQSDALHVLGEQGIGDQILFLRVLPSIRQVLDPRVEIHVYIDPRLVPSLSTVDGVRVHSQADPGDSRLSDATRMPEILEFLLRNGQQLTGLGCNVLVPEMAWEQALIRQLGVGASSQRRVGVCWKSTRKDGGDEKSVSPDLLGQLFFNRPDLVPILLQYDATPSEIGAFEGAAGRPLVSMQDVDLRQNISAAIGLTAACDVILTVSCTTAHYAGSLGKPGLVLVPKSSLGLWYWGEGVQTPWYPSLQCAHQMARGDWSQCLEQAKEFLK